MKDDHKKMVNVPIMFRLKRTENLIRNYLTGITLKKNIDDVTIMHGWVLHFLYDRQDTDIYQKDIEKQFSIAKSHVTGILKSLENYGYIQRISVPSDARLKKIVITDVGIKVHLTMIDTFNDVEKEIFSLFTEQEYKELHDYLIRIEDYMERKETK